jgi:hypothetical protein
MAKKGVTINPYLAGAVGAVGAVVLWETVLRPAPLDAVVWCGDQAKIKQIMDLLASNGIKGIVQNTMARYTALVKESDLQKARSIASKANLLTY